MSRRWLRGEQVEHELESFEGVEDADRLRLVEFFPRLHGASQQHRSQVDSVVTGQADLFGEQVCFASSSLGCPHGGCHHALSYFAIAKHVTLSGDIEALPVYMRRGHGHDTAWREHAVCALPQPHLLKKCGTVTAMTVEEAEPIVRRQVWTTDTLGAAKVVILGRRLPAVEVEQLALMMCNQCKAQWQCAAYALDADEMVGTWGIPQSWLEALRRKYREEGRAAAVIREGSAGRKRVQAFVRKLLFEGVTPR